MQNASHGFGVVLIAIPCTSPTNSRAQSQHLAILLTSESYPIQTGPLSFVAWSATKRIRLAQVLTRQDTETLLFQRRCYLYAPCTSEQATSTRRLREDDRCPDPTPRGLSCGGKTRRWEEVRPRTILGFTLNAMRKSTGVQGMALEIQTETIAELQTAWKLSA